MSLSPDDILARLRHRSESDGYPVSADPEALALKIRHVMMILASAGADVVDAHGRTAVYERDLARLSAIVDALIDGPEPTVWDGDEGRHYCVLCGAETFLDHGKLPPLVHADDCAWRLGMEARS
jgi:hypothetical protein